MQVITHFYQFREWIWTQRWAPLHDQEGFEQDSCSLHVHRKKAPEHQQQVYSLLEGRRCPKRVPKKVPQFFFIGKELSRSSQDEHVIKKFSSFISLFWPSWSPCTACTYRDQLQFFSRNIFGFFYILKAIFDFDTENLWLEPTYLMTKKIQSDLLACHVQTLSNSIKSRYFNHKRF